MLDKIFFCLPEKGIGCEILRDTRFKVSKRHSGYRIGPKNNSEMQEMS